MNLAVPHQTHSQRLVLNNWQGAASSTEATLHQLSPYIGKIKSSMAASLITQFTKKDDVVFDPFAGSGTVPLEAWICCRHVFANELNPYGVLLTQAKLFPYKSLDAALSDLEAVSKRVKAKSRSSIDLRAIPIWVRDFFDNETLREALLWVGVLKRSQRHFLLACLMGILHHQRPGFLSYPSSHSVPYLRLKKFPPSQYPELYKYRDLHSRLERKVRRAFYRFPKLDFDVDRNCTSANARRLSLNTKIDAIITSPPYMRSLDYARDNRLRLWFLGASDWRSLDSIVSPCESAFIKLMRQCFQTWKGFLNADGHCVIVAGDRYSRNYNAAIPDVITTIATKEVGGYRLITKYQEEIPDDRRVRRKYSGNSSETILVLERERD